MKRILFFFLFGCIAFSCEKEYYTTIPNYDVHLQLDLANSDIILKNTQYAYKTFTQPRIYSDRLLSRGILVINGQGESPLVNLHAFDLACPNEAPKNIHVKPDNTSAVPTANTATCPECGAVYIILDGSGKPQSGSKYYLKPYRVSGSGTQFTVHN